ncbi:MAG: SCO family protein [Magnetococcales bacterium]|nr:SCO family protein [Magnetococcales bacterium]NGZ28214.1 SCO family protein [Magnetococcales bacterium]
MNPAVRAVRYGLLLLGLVGIGWFYFMGSSSPYLPPELAGMMSGSPKELTPFQLVDQDNKPFTLESLKGQWTMLFFGYAHCPDICPMAMEEIKEAYGIMEKKSPAAMKNSRVMFVSVDPKRDPPEMLKGYITYFHKSFLAATGTEEALAAFSRQMGAGYRIMPGKTAEDYLVAHTSNFYLIDPRGQYVTYFNPPHDPEAIANKWLAIRKAYGEPI